MKAPIILWILRIAPAVILLQTLYFKFTASEESVYIFSTLGMEPVGRIGSGIAELVAAILILVPRTTFYGAIIAVGVMFGAITSHLFVVGIVVKDDGGLLFSLASATLLCCTALVYIERNKMIMLFNNHNRQ